MMCKHVVLLTAGLLAMSGCFDRSLGTTSLAGETADAATRPTADATQPADGCSFTPQPVVDASLSAAFPSNGASLMAGIDPDSITTLSGNCRLKAYTSEIICDGLVTRPNQAGIANGIGYQRLSPVAANCAGSETAAPPIAVFSFGSLEVAPGTTLFIEGREEFSHAVALVAARSVRIQGRVVLGQFTGGFSYDFNSADFPQQGWGPSPGAQADGERRAGASGGGASTPGGMGGSSGCQVAHQLPAQYEPLCGGSTGGMVGNDYGPGYESVIYGEGGAGGGALQISALETIELSGGAGCTLSADGSRGRPYERGGTGGGAGGTIILEAPAVAVGGECTVTANGGQGSDVQYNTGGLGGAGGTREAPAQPGQDAPDDGDPATQEYGGGGGGAAGFIRVRAASCDGDLSRISPEPDCDVLPGT